MTNLENFERDPFGFMRGDDYDSPPPNIVREIYNPEVVQYLKEDGIVDPTQQQTEQARVLDSALKRAAEWQEQTRLNAQRAVETRAEMVVVFDEIKHMLRQADKMNRQIKNMWGSEND